MGTNFNKEGKLQRDESKTKWIKLLVEERRDHNSKQYYNNNHLTVAYVAQLQVSYKRKRKMEQSNKRLKDLCIWWIEENFEDLIPVVLIILEPLIHSDNSQWEEGQGQLETKRHWRHLGCLPQGDWSVCPLSHDGSVYQLSSHFDASDFVFVWIHQFPFCPPMSQKML